MSTFNTCMPSYFDFINTVISCQNILEQYQSQAQLVIVKHTYPYRVEITNFDSYFQLHIFTLQGLLHLQNTIELISTLPF